jgi:hemerythrin
VFDFLFDWTFEFNTNIEILDTQHKEFFRIGRDLEQLIKIECIGVKDKQLLSIVADLKEYITYHFYEEEGMMLDYGYPDAEKHKESHRQFAKKIADINLIELKANPLHELTKIRDILQEKVFWHILSEDKKMVEYVIQIQNQMREDVASLEIKRDEFEEKYGLKICELDLSTAYLHRNQYNKGRCILIFKNKVNDIVQLTALERNIFFADLAKLSKAIKKAFSPDTFNYGEFGDVEERFHMHVVPKYMQLEQFGEPYHLNEQEKLLTDKEYKEIVEIIQKEISSLPL